MANKEELKNMVLQFKVTDLQLLLGFAGQNKNGRKIELQKKAVNLIHYKMSIPLEMKIRQMYRDMIPDPNVPKTNNGFCTSNNYSNKYDNYYMNGYSRPTSQNSSMFDNYSNLNCYTNSRYDNYCENFWPSLSYTNYSLNGHEGPSKLNSTNNGSFNVKVPSSQNLSNITFKKLPFYKYKSDILSVIPMTPKKTFGDFYELMHPFSLNQAQMSRLSSSNRYQVQLRICLLNEETEVKDDLPLALTVKVNDKNCQLPPAIPSTNKQGMLLKRMNAPINITSQTSKKNSVNSLFISWSVTCDKLYGVGIFLVRKYSAEELVEKLKEKGERDPEVTKKYLRDKLGQLDDGDDDIAATSLKVSLVCPLGKIKMTLPVRAITCNHLQCFDGILYIKMNDVKSTWQCPVCNQPCFYDDLFIDGYFVDVLRNDSLSSKTSEIQIEADGSVTPILPKKRPKTNATPMDSCKKIKTELIEPKSPENSNPVPTTSDFFHSFYGETCLQEPIPSSSTCDDRVTQSIADCSSTESIASKKVVLVDLTESDSEQEQNMPLNLKKYNDKTDDDPKLCASNGVNNEKKSPPVYDIDDFD